MTKILRLLLIGVVSLLFLADLAAASAPVTSSLEQGRGSEHNFLLKINIADGWKIYGPYPGDEGLPLSITSNASRNLAELKVMWPNTVRPDGVASSNNVYYGDIEIPLLAMATNHKDNIGLNLTLHMVACKDVCIRLAQDVSATGDSLSQSGNNISTIVMMVFALIGGFILNIMPCVLPVVTLKAYSIVKYSNKSEAHVRLNALLTVFGIVSTFACIALVVASARAAGSYIGWGFHFQHPNFLIVLSIILFISVMIMREEISISLPYMPASCSTHNEYIASFSSGVIATLLATPCTAPFITPVIAFALTQETGVIALLYCSIGVGMAIPFLLIAIWPKITRVLPKPGAWMVHLKTVFSLLMILTVIWLLYILSSQLGFKSALLLGGCLLLLKFFLTRLSTWKGVAAALIISIFMLNAPQMLRKQEIERAQLVDQYWEPFSQKQLDVYVARGEVVLVDVTADWCLLCKMNKLLVLDNVVILEFLQMHKVKMMRADITSPSADIIHYMKIHNREAIPFNMIYGPKSPFRIILPEILTINRIKNAINEVQK